MKESNIQKLIMLALSDAGCLVWRNNVGVLKNAAGIPIRFGLCVGSADLIGIAPGGRFLAVEIKTTTGRVRAEQTRFIDAVNRSGGIAGVCRTVEDALGLIGQ
jgi:hypothetical protein